MLTLYLGMINNGDGSWNVPLGFVPRGLVIEDSLMRFSSSSKSPSPPLAPPGMGRVSLSRVKTDSSLEN